jgi:hypothetical protein
MIGRTRVEARFSACPAGKVGVTALAQTIGCFVTADTPAEALARYAPWYRCLRCFGEPKEIEAARLETHTPL